MNRIVKLNILFLAVALGACQKGGPIKIAEVEPAEGIVGGGDSVIIRGSGFQPGKTQVEVRFGRHKAEQVVIAATNKINVVTPAGDKGPVDVILAFDDGTQYKIPNGFRYTVPQAQQDLRKAFFSGKAGQAAQPK